MEKTATTRTKRAIAANAVEILKEIVQHRNWHQGLIERRLAGVTKQNVLAGKLSYEKAKEILTLLGWKKVHEEVWKHSPKKNTPT